MNEIAHHYDILIEEGNDPVHDSRPLKEYMNKWDGYDFIRQMQIDNNKSVLRNRRLELAD